MGSLVKFREAAVASMVEDLVSACPGLAGFALQPVPLGPANCVDVLVPNMESVTRAVAWAHVNARTTNLSTCLEENWARGHQPSLLEKCPSLGDFEGTEPCEVLDGSVSLHGRYRQASGVLGWSIAGQHEGDVCSFVRVAHALA